MYFFVLAAGLRYFTDPWMIKELRNRWPLVLIFLKAQLDEVLRVIGNVLPIPIVERDLFVANVLIDSVQVLAVERRLTAEQLVDDDAEAPDVDLLGVSFVLHELRCHVKGCSEHQIEALFFVEFLRESQISDLDVEAIVVLLYEKDVLGFHVSVRDGLEVHVVESKHYLADDVGCLALGEAVQPCESVEKLATLYNL